MPACPLRPLQQVAPGDVDAAVLAGAVTLDIRDPDEHAIDFIAGENALHCSRGKLEMNIEKLIPGTQRRAQGERHVTCKQETAYARH